MALLHSMLHLLSPVILVIGFFLHGQAAGAQHVEREAMVAARVEAVRQYFAAQRDPGDSLETAQRLLGLYANGPEPDGVWGIETAAEFARLVNEMMSIGYPAMHSDDPETVARAILERQIALIEWRLGYGSAVD